MPKFGDYDANATPVVEPGMYFAMIKSADIVTDNGIPKVNDNGKNLVDVLFIVGEYTLKRRYTISFGQNTQNKQWSAFAKMLEATTGVRCGDPAQKSLDEEELRGRECRVVVDTNDRGYSDITNVLPAPKKEPAAAAKDPVAAKPVAAAKPPQRATVHHDDAGTLEDGDGDSWPDSP
jgi:hypothetical protein